MGETYARIYTNAIVLTNLAINKAVTVTGVVGDATTGDWMTFCNSVETRAGGTIPGSQSNGVVIQSGVATFTNVGSIQGRRIGVYAVASASVFSPKRAAWLRKNVPHFRECEAMMTRVQKEAQASRNAFAITANDRVRAQLAS